MAKGSGLPVQRSLPESIANHLNETHPTSIDGLPYRDASLCKECLFEDFFSLVGLGGT